VILIRKLFLTLSILFAFYFLHAKKAHDSKLYGEFDGATSLLCCIQNLNLGICLRMCRCMYMYLYREDPRQSSVLIAFHGNVTTTRTILTKVKENLFRVSRCEPHLAFCFSSSFSFCLCSIKVSIPKSAFPPPPEKVLYFAHFSAIFCPPEAVTIPKVSVSLSMCNLKPKSAKSFSCGFGSFQIPCLMPHAPVSSHPPLSYKLFSLCFHFTTHSSLFPSSLPAIIGIFYGFISSDRREKLKFLERS